METLSNREVEDRAIAWVMRLERAAGRHPVDTRGRADSPVDIISRPRVIEVKAYGRFARGQDLWMEPAQVDEALRNPDFHLYVVENVSAADERDYVLRVLEGRELEELLSRRREHRYFTLPWSVRSYDRITPGLDPAGR